MQGIMTGTYARVKKEHMREQGGNKQKRDGKDAGAGQ